MTKDNMGGVDLETVSADIVAQVQAMIRDPRGWLVADMYALVAGTLMEHDAIAQGHTTLSKERQAAIDEILAAVGNKS